MAAPRLAACATNFCQTALNATAALFASVAPMRRERCSSLPVATPFPPCLPARCKLLLDVGRVGYNKRRVSQWRVSYIEKWGEQGL